jgi:hypothetical protein
MTDRWVGDSATRRFGEGRGGSEGFLARDSPQVSHCLGTVGTDSESSVMNLMETAREARVEIGNWSGSGNAKDNGTKAGQDPIVILVSGGGGAPFYIQSPTPSNAFHISHQLTKGDFISKAPFTQYPVQTPS